MKAMYPRRQQMHTGLGNALVAGVVSPSARPRRGLPPPQQLSPANGAVFNNFPRTTTLRWGPVPRAASYSVELDCFQCCAANKWCTAVGRTWQIVTGIAATQYVFNWVGAQPGRWRVWAVGPRGQSGRKSRWSKFIYTV
jgi:eukaryotic-like serine/threonine-protein kinase